MRKLVSFCLLVCFTIIIHYSLFTVCERVAYADDTKFEISVNNKDFCFSQSQIAPNEDVLSKWNRNGSKEQQKELFHKILNMGFTKENALEFIFPGLFKKIDEVEEQSAVAVKDAEIFFNAKNSSFSFEREAIGKKMDKNALIEELVQSLEEEDDFKIRSPIITIDPKVNLEALKKCVFKKAAFATYLGDSNEARKSNIKTAFASFNGKKLEPGETFSFNAATGVRNEKAGYKKAKIISRGTFIQGLAGGVCQASTTLYNAVLRAGLEVVEVHQHSSPVSYVLPSCDAMVNIGSADLVFKNNTSGPIFLKAFVLNNESAIVEIWGMKNEFDYSVRSVICEFLPKSEIEEILTDTSLSPKPLLPGETYRLSYARDGMISEAYLEAEKNGKQVFSKRIRKDRYNPVRSVVVKG